MKRPRRSLALLLAALAAACGERALLTDPPAPEDRVPTLLAVSGAGQRKGSGRRSPLPFRIRALDAEGAPVADAEVVFRVTGEGWGVPTQPRAPTDCEGYAESWLQYTRSGAGVLIAEAGTGRAEMAFIVDRAPGEIRFLLGTGEAGLPGRLHPDSMLEVRVIDTEGRPPAGQEVWFAGPGQLSRSADTTDADGDARVLLRRTQLSAGAGDVYAFILGSPELLAHDTRRILRPARRVVLVSVDGLRADAAERWSAPTLQRLAREGAAEPRARTVSPTLTAPAHLSLLSGVRPQAHGIFADELDFTPEMASLDPVFRHASQRGAHALAFVSREGPLAAFERALACRLAFGLDSLYLTPPRAADVANAAGAALADPTVDLLFLHFPDPDLAGHEHGFGSREYGEAVLAAVAASPGALLIVTSDHGGGGAWGPYQHGSGSLEDVEVPLLIWGERVAAGTRLEPAMLLDVALTVLWALGMAPPYQYEGRPLLEGFQ